MKWVWISKAAKEAIEASTSGTVDPTKVIPDGAGFRVPIEEEEIQALQEQNPDLSQAIIELSEEAASERLHRLFLDSGYGKSKLFH